MLLDGTLFEVTNPRDRVYVYVGTAMDITSCASTDGRGCGCDRTAKFPIDYKKSVSVAYQDLVKYLINRDIELGSLQICESRLNRNPDLPSWATDFRRQMPWALTDRGSRQLRAKRQDLSQINKLTLDGRWVGVVEHVDEPDPASLLAGWKDCTGAFPDIHDFSQDFIYFRIEEDFDSFVASGQCRHATTCPRKRRDLGSNTSESRRKLDERAFR